MTGRNIFSGLKGIKPSDLEELELNLPGRSTSIIKSQQDIFRAITTNHPNGHYDLKEFIRSYLIPSDIFEQIIDYVVSTAGPPSIPPSAAAIRLRRLEEALNDYHIRTRNERGNNPNQQETKLELLDLINKMEQIIKDKKAEQRGLVNNNDNWPALGITTLGNTTLGNTTSRALPEIGDRAKYEQYVRNIPGVRARPAWDEGALAEGALAEGALAEGAVRARGRRRGRGRPNR